MSIGLRRHHVAREVLLRLEQDHDHDRGGRVDALHGHLQQLGHVGLEDDRGGACGANCYRKVHVERDHEGTLVDPRQIHDRAFDVGRNAPGRRARVDGRRTPADPAGGRNALMLVPVDPQLLQVLAPRRSASWPGPVR